jgi:hypothetical protein
MLRQLYFIAATLLVGLVTFALSSAVGAALALLWSILVGGVALVFVRLIDTNAGVEPSEVGAMVMSGCALAFSGSLKWLADAPTLGWHDAIAVPVGMAAAWGLNALTGTPRGGTCFICKLPLGKQPVFACPRCHQIVCARPSCWMARHFRCRYCDERDVIVFPIDERWWKPRLGERVRSGACGSCFKEANEADLRECGRCRWPMCKRCWDHHNGQCTHCQWVMPGLPPDLETFMMAARRSAEQRDAEPAARRRS